jgi:WD40 repeat protein
MDSDETNVKLPMRTIADRDAVGIATLDSSGNVIREYYFDAVYGWMLLMNQYSQSNPGVLLQRVQIEHILFNVPFSSIWDNPTFPLLIGYQPEPVSKDHQSPVEAPEWIGWPPEEIELISPGYNLANAALSFQSTMGYSQINTFDRRLQITAGSHLVGNLRTSYYGPQILSITCRRSPDGQKLAFEGTFGDQRIFSGTAVTWLDLFSLAESQREILDLQLPDQYSDRFHILILPVDPVEKALPEEDYYSGNAISDLTFSPDGNRLAVVTARWQLVGPNNTVYYRQGGIYIADLSAGEVLSDTQAMPPIPAAQLLESVVDGRSLVWSPDGSQLALIVVVNNSNRQSGSSATTVEEIWVLDTASGAVVFREPLDLLNGRPIGDWPMLTWGVDFPVDVVKGLEGCASVPVR